MRIALVGSYPPPIGGNSVHVKRLHDYIRAQGFPCDVIDLYADNRHGPSFTHVYRYGPAGVVGLMKALLHLRKQRYDVVHFHVSGLKRFIIAGVFLLLLLPLGSKTLITIHSGSFRKNFSTLGKFRKLIARYLFRSADHLITVNEDQKSLVLEQGIAIEKISMIPAYLPPETEPSPQLDQLVREQRSNDRLIVISSGSAHPLYGLHTIVDALIERVQTCDNLSLILCVYDNENYEPGYLESLRMRLQQFTHFNIQSNLTSEQFSYLLSQSDIYIRATTTDGDSVAVREALHFGLTVIASDSAPRPQECILFKTSDAHSLQNALMQIVAGTVATSASRSHPGEQIINIYTELGA
jgi:glycosyltransferase involved in cell wall biosynthesis